MHTENSSHQSPQPLGPSDGPSCVVATGSATSALAHGLSVGELVEISGRLYRVDMVQDADSFTLRNPRWYDLVLWHLKRAWKWLTSFLPNGRDEGRAGSA